jgi:TRAP-type mannitol/chloroaromatic compound transport system permease small subunit
MPSSPRLRRAALALERVLDRITDAVAWLVLPLALLLFLQWPLRDGVGAYSRQANDIAQWLFALYVAFAVRAATRQRAHLAAGLVTAHHASRWRRRIDRYGEAILVLPWAVFVLVAGAPSTWRSLASLEAFPDTSNPLYFVIRCSAWLLALAVLLQAVVGLLVADDRAPADHARDPDPVP